jgi:preprotein translocase subunit SecD
MGFTLSLAGVAGLIVAIGITADSFVVFFERLRDEVREGRTLRTAVEHGWTRARRTIIASDFVSFLAAAVLYFMSIGSVKGFAFTLGLTTVIDIVVVFLFTKPLVTLAARSEFFGGGHKWSGLDPVRLGANTSAFRHTGAATAGAGGGTGRRMTIAERRKAAEQAAAGDVESNDTKRVDV